MLRHCILTVYLFTSLVAAHSTAAAQSSSNIPTRLTVSSDARTLQVRQPTTIRIGLLNENGEEIVAGEDISINLICTILKDLNSAKSAARGDEAQSQGALQLPAGRNTVQLSITLAKA